jgi:hypothetical protein
MAHAAKRKFLHFYMATNEVFVAEDLYVTRKISETLVNVRSAVVGATR